MIVASKNIGTINSSNLAEFVVAAYGPISHLKLQKLIFYIQAYHLAHFDAPIIDDDFEAWVHGPVSRKIYNEIRGVSVLYTEIKFIQDANKPAPGEVLRKSLTEEQINLMTDVLSEIGDSTDLELENMTHSEAPWQDARQGYGPGDKCNVVIPKEKIKEYYKTQLYG